MQSLEFIYKGVKFSHLEHDTVFVQWDKYKIAFDPFRIKEATSVDAVFITHDHFDHFSPNDLRKIITTKTKLICPRTIINKIQAGVSSFMDINNIVAVELLKKESLMLGDTEITFIAVPAYNLNKYRTENEVYHPQASGYVGYLLDFNNIKVYFAGDTDLIPEMSALAKTLDIAFIPISGTYVMTIEEAIEAVKIFLPKVVVPMHYGSIVGEKSLGVEFKKRILNIYDNKIKVYAKE